MNDLFHVGQKVIYYREGFNHTSTMDKYIGKVITVTEAYVFCVKVKEDPCGFSFAKSALMPVTSKIR